MSDNKGYPRNTIAYDVQIKNVSICCEASHRQQGIVTCQAYLAG